MEGANLAQSVVVKEYTQTLSDPPQNPAELDLAAAQVIPMPLLVRERDLYRLKWFDYRSLHPVTATRLFANEYRKASARFSQKRVDENQGFYKTGLSHVDVLEMDSAAVRTSLWKCRQFADEMCYPYDALLFAAMKYAEERCWGRAPRPHQIYSGEFAIAMRTLRLEDSRIKIRLAEKPEYKADAYAGYEDQDDYQEYLVALIKQRPNHTPSAKFLVEQGHLLPHVAIKEFGDSAVAQVIFPSR